MEHFWPTCNPQGQWWPSWKCHNMWHIRKMLLMQLCFVYTLPNLTFSTDQLRGFLILREACLVYVMHSNKTWNKLRRKGLFWDMDNIEVDVKNKPSVDSSFFVFLYTLTCFLLPLCNIWLIFKHFPQKINHFLQHVMSKNYTNTKLLGSISQNHTSRETILDTTGHIYERRRSMKLILVSNLSWNVNPFNYTKNSFDPNVTCSLFHGSASHKWNDYMFCFITGQFWQEAFGQLLQYTLNAHYILLKWVTYISHNTFTMQPWWLCKHTVTVAIFSSKMRQNN